MQVDILSYVTAACKWHDCFYFSFWTCQRLVWYSRWQLKAVLGRWWPCGRHWCFTISWKTRLKSGSSTRSAARLVGFVHYVVENSTLLVKVQGKMCHLDITACVSALRIVFSCA